LLSQNATALVAREGRKRVFAAVGPKDQAPAKIHGTDSSFRINSLLKSVREHESLPFRLEENTGDYYRLENWLLRELQPGECNLREKC
jgi:hypothetical protein